MAEMIKIPIEEKVTLTLGEAASYSGIGMNKLRELSNQEDCDFVLWNFYKAALALLQKLLSKNIFLTLEYKKYAENVRAKEKNLIYLRCKLYRRTA